jgi:hypothetical protein
MHAKFGFTARWIRIRKLYELADWTTGRPLLADSSLLMLMTAVMTQTCSEKCCDFE